MRARARSQGPIVRIAGARWRQCRQGGQPSVAAPAATHDSWSQDETTGPSWAHKQAWPRRKNTAWIAFA